MSKKGNLGDRTGLKLVPGGPNELKVRTPVDFDLAVLILRVLEAWELGNSGLYRKYWPYIKILKKSKNFKILFWSQESKKPIFLIFPDFFTKKSGKSILRNFRKSQPVGFVIASETPW